MRAAKFLILGVAIAAGVGAVYLVQGELERARMSAAVTQPEPAPRVEAPAPKAAVLVAAGRFKRGHILRPRDFAWRDWPEDAVAEAFVTRERSPDAVDRLTGSVVRSSISVGEPILEDKLINVDHPGALAAMLRPGMRGFAIRIGPETGAGGLIVPGNYVDIVLTRSDRVQIMTPSGQTRTKNILFTNTLVRTARVVAVDTELDDEGRASIEMRRTLTLELTAEQVELLSLAEEAGRITVAVRSIGDLVDGEGRRIAEPFPTLAVDLDTFAGASLAWPGSDPESYARAAAPQSAQDAADRTEAEPKQENEAPPPPPSAVLLDRLTQRPDTYTVTILRFDALSRAQVAARRAAESEGD